MSPIDSKNNENDSDNDNSDRTIRDGVEVNQGQILKRSTPTIIESQFSRTKKEETSETQTNVTINSPKNDSENH